MYNFISDVPLVYLRSVVINMLPLCSPPLFCFSVPSFSCFLSTSLTTCGCLLFLSTVLPRLPSPPSLPEDCAHCALPSIRLVIGRSGAAGEDCVGLGSFPCSDYPGLLSGNEPPLPPPPLHLPHLLASSLSSFIRSPFSQTNYCTPPFPTDLITFPLPVLLHSVWISSCDVCSLPMRECMNAQPLRVSPPGFRKAGGFTGAEKNIH